MAKKVNGFVWGAFAGGLIGSVTALLLAPKSGRELRSDIGEYAVKAADSASEIGDKISAVAASAAKQTAAGASVLKEKAIHTADTVASGIRFWNRSESDDLAVIASTAAHGTDSDSYDSVEEWPQAEIDSHPDDEPSGKI